MTDEITVLIADDHPIFRQGLGQLISADAGLKLVAEVADGTAALERIEALGPRVAVLDVDMPGRDGFAVAREVAARRLAVALVFLTMHRDERFFNAALDLGVRGYVLKDSAVTEIVTAVRAAAAGQAYVTPALTGYLLGRRRAGEGGGGGRDGLSALTESERRVLRLVAEYRTSREIADELFISVRTVERHRANIASKLDLKGSHALLHFALEHKAEL